MLKTVGPVGTFNTRIFMIIILLINLCFVLQENTRYWELRRGVEDAVSRNHQVYTPMLGIYYSGSQKSWSATDKSSFLLAFKYSAIVYSVWRFTILWISVHVIHVLSFLSILMHGCLVHIVCDEQLKILDKFVKFSN